MTDSLNECRTVFEERAKDNYRLIRREDGYYLDLPTEAAWNGWKNAWRYFTEVKKP